MAKVRYKCYNHHPQTIDDQPSFEANRVFFLRLCDQNANHPNMFVSHEPHKP